MKRCYEFVLEDCLSIQATVLYILNAGEFNQPTQLFNSKMFALSLPEVYQVGNVSNNRMHST